VNTGAIAGPILVACGTNSETYSVVNNIGSTYTWSVPNGATITDGQGTHEIQVDFNNNFGDVSVVETNEFGCQGEPVKISVNCNVGLVQNAQIIYSIFPNPTSDKFTVEVEGHNGNSTFELFDTKGMLISKHSFEEFLFLNIENYAKGVYLGMITVNEQKFLIKIVKS
jgi:hypothetical protein